MRVAVLGCNSFAARDLIELLQETGGFEILGVGRSQQTWNAHERFSYRRFDVNADAAELCAALDAFEPQYIVNYAAQGDDAASWHHPADFFQTNCVALARLLDHLKTTTYLQRFLQISSSGVYGGGSSAITEESPYLPQSPYAVSKTAADLLLLAYHRNFEFPAQIIRPPNLYGPYQQTFRIIPKAIFLLKRGHRIELHGGGRALRFYLHIRDASRAALLILQRGAIGSAYNISPDAPCSIREIVAMVCELLGKDFAANTRDVADRVGQQSVALFDSTKIRRELDWQPAIGLHSGIQSVVERIERDWDQIGNDELIYEHKI